MSNWSNELMAPFWTYSIRCNLRGPHDEVIKWKHLPRYWPFVRGIHRSPVNSPHKGQWRGARINGWVNTGEAGDLRRHRAHHDVIVMSNLLTLGLWQGSNNTKDKQHLPRVAVTWQQCRSLIPEALRCCNGVDYLALWQTAKICFAVFEMIYCDTFFVVTLHTAAFTLHSLYRRDIY